MAAKNSGTATEEKKQTREDVPTSVPAQEQKRQPGLETKMDPRPMYDDPNYVGSGKLKDKVALISGGDSGIGRAVAVAFAKEGADVVIAFLDEEKDAKETAAAVEECGRKALLLPGDLKRPQWSKELVEKSIKEFGKLNILVNNAAVQFEQQSLEEISDEQLEKTFETNIFSYFRLTRAVLPHMSEGDAIINTASITAYHGHKTLMDYAATKGAIVAFTRSLAMNIVEKGIRVNAVAPGPIWTPLIPSSFESEKVEKFGSTTPMKRPGQPFELAPAYVFLASGDSSYVTGQTIHVNGGGFITS